MAKRKSYCWDVTIRGSKTVRVLAKTYGNAIHKAKRELKMNTRENTPDGGFVDVACGISDQQ